MLSASLNEIFPSFLSLDEKYTENHHTSTTGWASSKRAGDKKEHVRTRTQNGYDHKPSAHPRPCHAASPKRVDFLPSFQLREVNNDGTYLDSVSKPVDLAYAPCGSQSNMADGHQDKLKHFADGHHEKVKHFADGHHEKLKHFADGHHEKVKHFADGHHEKVKHFASGDTGANMFDFSNVQRTSGVAQLPGYCDYGDRLMMEPAGAEGGFEPTIAGRREGDVVSKRGAGLFIEGKSKTRLLKKNLTDLPQENGKCCCHVCVSVVITVVWLSVSASLGQVSICLMCMKE